MVGRGLGGTPNLSEAAFHGARTSDLRESARVLRQTLPSQTSIFVVGTSMGGIIVTNAVARDVLTGLVDGCISISGSFDSSKNTNFRHSIDLWQPLLAHGIKESFVAPIGALRKMKRRMGPLAADIVEGLKSVVAFDTFVVTSLHNFRDVYHYYADMSGANDRRLLAIIAEGIKNHNDSLNSDATSLSNSSPLGSPGMKNVEADFDVAPLVCLQSVYIDARKANSLEFLLAGEKESGVCSDPLNMEDIEYVKVVETMATADKIGSEICLKNEVLCKQKGPLSSSLPLPLLAIHAADDPILHVDSMPCNSGIVHAIDNLVMTSAYLYVQVHIYQR
jgi:hypothetical protein